MNKIAAIIGISAASIALAASAYVYLVHGRVDAVTITAAIWVMSISVQFLLENSELENQAPFV